LARLVIETGHRIGTDYPLKGELVIIGRIGDVRIEDAKASREHSKIVKKEEGYCLFDLESRNGTFLNDKRITEALLHSGDRITIGDTVLVFVEEEEEGLAGKEIAGFKFLEVLKRRPESILWRGWQTSLQRDVILEVLTPRLARNKAYMDRFLERARSASNYNHAHILQIFDVIREEQGAFVCYEFFEGFRLRRAFEEVQYFSPEEALEMVLQVGDALRYLHARDVIHGGLSPESILVSDEKIAKVTDVDRLKLPRALAPRGEDALFFARYRSSEDARGQALLPASDVYSLGTVFFHMVTFQPPFSGDSVQDILRKHVRQDPPDAADLNPEIPGAMAKLIGHMLSKEPENRYPNGKELLDALQDLKKRITPSSRAFTARSSADPGEMAAVVPAAEGQTGPTAVSAEPAPEMEDADSSEVPASRVPAGSAGRVPAAAAADRGPGAPADRIPAKAAGRDGEVSSGNEGAQRGLARRSGGRRQKRFDAAGDSGREGSFSSKALLLRGLEVVLFFLFLFLLFLVSSLATQLVLTLMSK
jgi:serine/threonine protein kinase